LKPLKFITRKLLSGLVAVFIVLPLIVLFMLFEWLEIPDDKFKWVDRVLSRGEDLYFEIIRKLGG